MEETLWTGPAVQPHVPTRTGIVLADGTWHPLDGQPAPAESKGWFRSAPEEGE